MMQYQVRYRDDLNIIDGREPSQKEIANHFAQNGYDPLYICENYILRYVITFEDFSKNEINKSLNRGFIQHKEAVLFKKDIINCFADNPSADRIVVLDDEKIYCEINSLIELSLQNSTAKNLMALRYIQFFKDEIDTFFSDYSKILLIANKDICDYFVKSFPKVKFEAVEDIKQVYDLNFINQFDLAFDFIYSKKIRKSLAIDIPCHKEFCQVLTRFALNRLLAYSSENKVHVKFYKLPRYADLTCLNTVEYDNYINRKTLGSLVKSDEYLEKFVRNEAEYNFIKKRDYHSSHRLDNGYCFVQDESNHCYMHVHNGIRSSGIDAGSCGPCWNFYGPCTAYGFLVPDNMTVPALIMQYAREDNVDLQVANRAGIHGDNELNSIMEALGTPVRPGDSFIFLDVLEDLPVEEYPDFHFVGEWFNKMKSSDEVQFMDFPGHCNSDANRIMAKCIYDDMKIENTICELGTHERKAYINQQFDPLELIAMTHSSCVKFLQKYRNMVFKKGVYKNVGSIILPDNFLYEKCMKYVNICLNECDALYVFVLNDNVEKLTDNKKIYDHINAMTISKPVRVITLEHFYNANRYLDEALCFGDCYPKAVFTERVFTYTVMPTFGINIRFCMDETRLKKWNQAIFEANESDCYEIKKIRL